MSEDDINVIRIYVEEIQGGLYAWEEETHRFLGQGTTANALMERIKEDLPEGMVHVLQCHVDRGGRLLQDRGCSEIQEF